MNKFSDSFRFTSDKKRHLLLHNENKTKISVMTDRKEKLQDASNEKKSRQFRDTTYNIQVKKEQKEEQKERHGYYQDPNPSHHA